MANSKTGFRYYNIDTDRYQDIRIKRLKKMFGCEGISVYDYLLCEIYRVNGFYIDWSQDLAFDISEYFNIDEDNVNNIVSYCCNIGLFNAEFFHENAVLTSKSIQERYLEMSIRAKRKDAIIPEKYIILPEESKEIQEESNIPFKNHKVKESKVKESKVNNTPLPPLEGDTIEKDKIDFQKLGELFNSLFDGVLPKVTLPISESRKSPIRARAKEFGKEKILEMFQTALNSPHLLGNNDRGWKASFDWLFKPTNFVKVIEGNYLDKKKNGNITIQTGRNTFSRNDAADRRASVANAKELAISILCNPTPKEN